MPANVSARKGKRPGGNDIAQRNLEAAKRHQRQQEANLGDEVAMDEEDEEEPSRTPKYRSIPQ